MANLPGAPFEPDVCSIIRPNPAKKRRRLHEWRVSWTTFRTTASSRRKTSTKAECRATTTRSVATFKNSARRGLGSNRKSSSFPRGRNNRSTRRALLWHGNPEKVYVLETYCCWNYYFRCNLIINLPRAVRMPQALARFRPTYRSSTR